MAVNFIVGFAIAAILLIFLWSIKGLLLTPISGGKNTQISVDLVVIGSEPKLEQSLRGIVWLRENGTLKANIRINAESTDAATRHIARTYADKYGFITFSEDGETYGRAK